MESPSSSLLNPAPLRQAKPEAEGITNDLVHRQHSRGAGLIGAWLVWMFSLSSPHRRRCWRTELLSGILEMAHSPNRPASTLCVSPPSGTARQHLRLPGKGRKESDKIVGFGLFLNCIDHRRLFGNGTHSSSRQVARVIPNNTIHACVDPRMFFGTV